MGEGGFELGTRGWVFVEVSFEPSQRSAGFSAGALARLVSSLGYKGFVEQRVWSKRYPRGVEVPLRRTSIGKFSNPYHGVKRRVDRAQCSP